MKNTTRGYVWLVFRIDEEYGHAVESYQKTFADEKLARRYVELTVVNEYGCEGVEWRPFKSCPGAIGIIIDKGKPDDCEFRINYVPIHVRIEE